MDWIKALGFAALLTIGSDSFGGDPGLSEPAAMPSDKASHAVFDEAGLGALERISHLPSILPVILENGDALEMTEEQLATFKRWRNRNYRRMVEVMNGIIRKRIELSQGALDPSLVGEQLVTYQDTIFELQRELLLIRLSCRELLMSVFNDRQWENLAFLAEDHPKLAGLVHARASDQARRLAR